MNLLNFRHCRDGFAVLALLLGAGLLSGCGANIAGTPQGALPGIAIHGNVHGGVYPIQDATVRLMETQSNGYGGPAKQLLQTTSDSNGYFTFPDTGWSCDANQFAYITVTSGHTASNNTNNNVGQIGVIGNCGQFLSTQSEIDNVQVFVSELSTIAAAYALRSFITVDDTQAATGGQIINISAPANNNAPSGVCSFTGPTSCVAAGLAHAFQNAYNMVDSVNFSNVLPSGQARNTPPTNRFAYIPQAMINTLGNILQSCVDSSGGVVGTYSSYTPGTSRCGDLFWLTTPPGGASPTDTLEAALSMAQYPTNNVTSLFALQPRAVFFNPTLSQAPHDLSLSVFYLTETFGQYTGNLTFPVGLALDSNDDAFVLATSALGSSNTETAVLGLSTNGAVLFAGPVSTTYLHPAGIATDALDNIWFTNDSAGTSGALLKADPATGVITTGTLLPGAAGVAADKFNNVWVSLDSTSANSIQEFTNASLSGGTVTPTAQSNVLGASLMSLSLDGAGDVWAVNASGSNAAAVVLRTPAPQPCPGTPAALVRKRLTPAAALGIAANAAGEVYFPLSNQVNDSI